MKPLCFSLALAVIFVFTIVHAEAKPLADADADADAYADADADADPGIGALFKLIARVALKLIRKIAPHVGMEVAQQTVLNN
ncbi:hypothetical protein DMN91_011280 [Ooceraea biroi]|uniref:Uncharacterized protein n=1 Tax=Ooceraea biroi TaxID=2015173 RepID=A0A3L8DA69_OOCBI|nr:pilosulin-1-like [Ooceraea biroi]RLU17211.1 hypothetical protein DMN91_011280 [Ooceraea biroi]